jgi:PIN domain nuclease of toxin-antitoxin system
LRLLLDTHAVIWWFLDNPALSRAAREAIEPAGAEILVSAASAFEISLKHWSGKLPDAEPLARRLGAMVLEEGFQPLPITLEHGRVAGALPWAHKDPFDRLLVAQALVEDMPIVSNERVFDLTGVSRIW